MHQLSAYAALALLALATLPSSLAVQSIVTDWLTVTQSTVIATGIDHQTTARLYGDVASGKRGVCVATGCDSSKGWLNSSFRHRAGIGWSAL